MRAGVFAVFLSLSAAILVPAGPARSAAPFIYGPSYDSGWVDLDKGASKTLYHYLYGDKAEYLGYMECRAALFHYPNQRFLGTAFIHQNPPSGLSDGDWVGSYWSGLDGAAVEVFRATDDIYCPEARYRIWRPAIPDYDSGEVALSPGEIRTLTHNLGGDPDDYYVNMVIDGASQPKNVYLGGVFKTDNSRIGAYWRSLSSSQITIRRLEEDATTYHGVRVRIYRMPPAHYDSGWQAISQGQVKNFVHDLGGGASNMVVILDQKCSVYGVNQMYIGGAHMGTKTTVGHYDGDRVGSAWIYLSSTFIQVHRLEEDDSASEVRVRIYRSEVFNLPFLMNTLLMAD